MKTKNILQGCAIATACCMSFTNINVYAGGPPVTYFPEVNGTSLMNQNDVLEVSGKLKVFNLSGPQLQADKMVTVGPDGRLKERPIPPIGGPGGPPINIPPQGPLSHWKLVGTDAIRTDDLVGIKRDPEFELDVAGTINASQYLLNGTPLPTSPWVISGDPINGPIFRIGRVGIGTATPNSVIALDIAGGGSNTWIRVRNTANTAGGIILEGGAGGQQVFITSTGSGNNQGGNKFIIKKQDTTDVFVIDLNNSNVGIGTTNPQSRLHVVGDIRSTGTITANNLNVDTANFTRLVTRRIVSPDSIISIGDGSVNFNTTWNRIFPTTTGTFFGLVKGLGLGNLTLPIGLNSTAIGFRVGTALGFGTNSIIIGSGIPNGVFFNGISNSLMVGFNSTIPTLFVGPSSGLGTTGVVRIGTETIASGTPHDDYKLSVDGKIVARKLVSTEVNWADDEFEKDLTLDDLEKEEMFVDKHSHLEGIPSGKEVEKNGIDHAEMSGLQMRKIEQIYLYLFEMNKEIKEIKKDNKQLKEENKKLKQAFISLTE